MKTIIFFTLLISISVFASGWGNSNNPSLMGQMKYRFAGYSNRAHLAVTPWSDSYWPSQQSGIAHRWNHPEPNDFNYHLYSKSEVRRLSEKEMMGLSPAEKLDILSGRYDYPTVKAEWQRTSPQDEYWEGLCHGKSIYKIKRKIRDNKN